MRQFKINKGDSKEARRSKRRAYQTFKRRDKFYEGSETHFSSTKRGKYHIDKKGPIKYSISIERFYQKNAALARQ